MNEEVLELLREMDRKISALQTDVFSLDLTVVMPV